ncbi:MAG: zinc ribbon domain-containing protein [Roseburia sp.]|nr:zinc ribbon domain-containing protein [Roseburia sp.]
MMKCPYCGAPLDLDDNFCSHCGKLNEQVRQHVDDMNRFQSEFVETKEEVYQTTKRYTATSVRMVMIAVLVILNVVVAVIGSRYYSFERMLGEADCERHFEEYSAILDGYLAEGEYYSFYNFMNEKHVPSYDSAYEQYNQVENLVSEYIYIYEYLLKAYMEDDVEQRENLCKFATDNLEYFYENLDPERYSYNENADREENLSAIADLKEKVAMLLVTYGGVAPEDAARFENYTSAKRAMLLEEGLLHD